MSTSLTMNAVSAGVGWIETSTTAWGASNQQQSGFNYSTTFAQGTGVGKAQKLFVDQVTIATSTTQTYDLSGTLTDPLGNACVFTNVKGVYLEHTTTTATGTAYVNGIFLFGTGTTQPFILGTATAATDAFILKPGGVLFFTVGPYATAGYTVTNSTADLLKITNNDAASIVVKVVVWGE